MRPYSLYAYGMVDGRIKFALVPRRSALLVNIKQMTIYYNPKVRCTLVLLSFETNCLVAFDARYFQNENGKMKNESFEATVHDCIRKGQPVVFEIDRGTVTASPLDPEEFQAKY